MAHAKYDLIIKDDQPADISSLVLMKFPAMRSQLENPADLVSLSYKPKSMKFKLEIELDKSDPSYHRSTAVQVDRSGQIKQVDKSVDKNVYSSTKVANEDGQLFVCQLVNNQIVCRPISHLITMRSDFSHLDIKDEPDPNQEIRPISVKFASTDHQNRAAKPINKNQDEEDEASQEFNPMIYKPISSREATNQRVALFGKQGSRIKPDPDLKGPERKPLITMPDIKPKIEPINMDEEAYSKTPSKSQANTSTNTAMKDDKLRELVKECLIKAKIASFQEIYSFVRQSKSFKSQDVSSKEILDCLSEYALLVQGNWAIKSETLYGTSADSDGTAVTDISINLFITARDYLLYLFDQNRLVSRLEFSRKVRMPDHDVLELFNQLAKFRPELKEWELKLPTDKKFLERFPEVFQRQATFWKVRRANKLSALVI